MDGSANPHANAPMLLAFAGLPTHGVALAKANRQVDACHALNRGTHPAGVRVRALVRKANTQLPGGQA